MNPKLMKMPLDSDNEEEKCLAIPYESSVSHRSEGCCFTAGRVKDFEAG